MLRGESRLTGEAAILRLLSPDLRVLLFQVFGVLGLLVTVFLCRFLLDNRVVFIDAEGIRVRSGFGEKSGYWRDFVGVRRVKVRRSELLFLNFATSSHPAAPASASRSVPLHARLLGLDAEQILAEVEARVLASRRMLTIAQVAKVSMPARTFGRRGALSLDDR